MRLAPQEASCCQDLRAGDQDGGGARIGDGNVQRIVNGHERINDASTRLDLVKVEMVLFSKEINLFEGYTCLADRYLEFQIICFVNPIMISHHLFDKVFFFFHSTAKTISKSSCFQTANSKSHAK